MKKLFLCFCIHGASLPGFAQQFFNYPGTPQFTAEQRLMATANVKTQTCHQVYSPGEEPSAENIFIINSYTENGWLIIERKPDDGEGDSVRIEHTYYSDGRPRIDNDFSSWNYDAQTGYEWKGVKLKTIIIASASSYELNYKYKGTLPVQKEIMAAEPGMDKNGEYTGKTVWWKQATLSYQYDAGQRLVLITTVSEEGESTFTFEYDSNGYLTKTTHKNANGGGNLFCEYEYNEKGLPILEKRRYEQDAEWDLFKFTYEYY